MEVSHIDTCVQYSVSIARKSLQPPSGLLLNITLISLTIINRHSSNGFLPTVMEHPQLIDLLKFRLGDVWNWIAGAQHARPAITMCT